MIQRLYIHNYRCLENFEVPFLGKPSTLIIGKNGSGKSTVGFALQVLQSIARGTNRVGELVGIRDFSRGRSDVPMRFEVEALISDNLYSYSLAFELPAGFKEMRVLDERLQCGGTPIFERDRAQVVLRRTAMNQEARFLMDWHLVALPLIQEQSATDPLSVFKNWLARMLVLGPNPNAITGDSTGDSLLPNRFVTNFGEWFAGLLSHSPAAYSRIDSFIRKIMPDFKDIKNPITGPESRSLSVQFLQDGVSLAIPFRDLSDGEKCFFICALLLASNESYGPVFCYWDEPDNYLSISEVGHFVMELRREFKLGGQLLITSHNSEAIRQFSQSNILFFERRNHFEPTVVRPVSELAVNGELVDALIRDDVGR